MKGFKDKDGKFHPTDKPYIKKKSKPSLNSKGVKLKTVTIKKLPNVFSRSENHRFEIDNGEISFRLDDFGWFWLGKEDQINGFMARMEGTEVWDGFVKDMEEAGVTVNMLKPYLLKSLTGKLQDNDDGLYELSGDNVRWKFGEDYDYAYEGEYEHFMYYKELPSDTTEEEFIEEFWNHWKQPSYDRWLEYEGEGYRKQLKEGIKDAKDFDDLEQVYKDVHDDIQENFNEFLHNEYIAPASLDAIEAIIKKRKEEGKTR